MKSLIAAALLLLVVVVLTLVMRTPETPENGPAEAVATGTETATETAGPTAESIEAGRLIAADRNAGNCYSCHQAEPRLRVCFTRYLCIMPHLN